MATDRVSLSANREDSDFHIARTVAFVRSHRQDGRLARLRADACCADVKTKSLRICNVTVGVLSYPDLYAWRIRSRL